MFGKGGTGTKGLLPLLCEEQGVQGAPERHIQHRPCESVNSNRSFCANAETTKQPTRAATVDDRKVNPI